MITVRAQHSWSTRWSAHSRAAPLERRLTLRIAVGYDLPVDVPGYLYGCKTWANTLAGQLAAAFGTQPPSQGGLAA